MIHKAKPETRTFQVKATRSQISFRGDGQFPFYLLFLFKVIKVKCHSMLITGCTVKTNNNDGNFVVEFFICLGE